MRTSIEVFLYPGDDDVRLITGLYGMAVSFGGEVSLNWMGSDGSQRAIAALCRLLNELEQFDDAGDEP